MTDDLVKRLRDVGKNYELARGVHVDIRQAADRIEELLAERKKDHENINLKADFIEATLNQLAGFSQHIEELEKQNASLEAKLNKLRAVSERALMLSLKYSHFKLHAMEPMHKAIAAAKTKGEQP